MNSSTPSLENYRNAITQATSSRDLEMLLYRALPLFYAEQGQPINTDTHFGVEAKLDRRAQSNSWEMWFNIQAPDAINMLEKFDPVLFNRMSGGKHQASAIVKNKIGIGFSPDTQPFQAEEVFLEQETKLMDKLNTANSIAQWWDVFFEELPWTYAKARGWSEPTEEQWKKATGLVASFRQKHADKFLDNTLPSGGINAGNVGYGELHLGGTGRYENVVEAAFYPCLLAHPLLHLQSQGTMGIAISKIDFSKTATALKEKIAEQATAYCSLHGTRGVPIYKMKEFLLKFDEFQLGTVNPDLLSF